MQNELSIEDVISDPLIAQLRKADRVSTQDFISLLAKASAAYGAGSVANLHSRRADFFYRTIGAGELLYRGKDGGQPMPETAAEEPRLRTCA
jgi:hypothetical protein